MYVRIFHQFDLVNFRTGNPNFINTFLGIASRKLRAGKFNKKRTSLYHWLQYDVMIMLAGKIIYVLCAASHVWKFKFVIISYHLINSKITDTYVRKPRE